MSDEKEQAEENGKTGPKRYTKKRKAKPIEIEQEDGTVKDYTIKEMMGPERAAFLQQHVKRLKINPANGKVVGVENFSGIQSALLCRCLYDDEDKLVKAADIDKEFPITLQDELFNDAFYLNGLDKMAENREKKD